MQVFIPLSRTIYRLTNSISLDTKSLLSTPTSCLGISFMCLLFRPSANTTLFFFYFPRPQCRRVRWKVFFSKTMSTAEREMLLFFILLICRTSLSAKLRMIIIESVELAKCSITKLIALSFIKILT